MGCKSSKSYNDELAKLTTRSHTRDHVVRLDLKPMNVGTPTAQGGLQPTTPTGKNTLSSWNAREALSPRGVTFPKTLPPTKAQASVVPIQPVPQSTAFSVTTPRGTPIPLVNNLVNRTASFHNNASPIRTASMRNVPTSVTTATTTAQLPTPQQQQQPTTTTMSDVVTLNVGGTLFTTSAATLCQEPRSVLASLCTSKTRLTVDNSFIVRDENGNVFLDLNPTVFAKLLEYLRTRRMMGDAAPPPRLNPEESPIFEGIIHYLKIQSLFRSTVTHEGNIVARGLFDRFSEMQRSSNVLVMEHGQVAQVESTAHGYVLGNLITQQAEWKLKVERMQENHWLMIGVCSKQPSSAASYGCRGVYGWTGGRSPWQFIDGLNSRCPITYGEGDVVVLTLRVGEVLLHIPRTGATHKLVLPSDARFQLHVNLYCVGDAIRMLSCNE